MGKTSFARSLGRHSHFANCFNLDAFDDGCTYAVFEDLPGGLKDLEYRMWLGGQLQFNVSDKYHKKRVIRWGKPSIYTSNYNPLEGKRMNPTDRKWLEANCVIVEVTKPLWKVD